MVDLLVVLLQIRQKLADRDVLDRFAMHDAGGIVLPRRAA